MICSGACQNTLIYIKYEIRVFSQGSSYIDVSHYFHSVKICYTLLALHSLDFFGTKSKITFEAVASTSECRSSSEDLPLETVKKQNLDFTTCVADKTLLSF
jgi:hypothetical protein